MERSRGSGGKSENIISMQTVLDYTLSLQKEVDAYKKKSEERYEVLFEKYKDLEQRSAMTQQENQRLNEENTILRKQLKQVSNQLLNMSSEFKFDKIERTAKNEPSFSYSIKPNRRLSLNSSHFTSTSPLKKKKKRRNDDEEERKENGNFRSYRFNRSFSGVPRRRKEMDDDQVRHSYSGTRTRRRPSTGSSHSSQRSKSTSQSRPGGYRTIFDKLCDPDLYTGVYAQRFRTGKGGINQFTGDKILSLGEITRPGLGPYRRR